MKPKSQANFDSLASPGVRRMSSGQTSCLPPSLGRCKTSTSDLRQDLYEDTPIPPEGSSRLRGMAAAAAAGDTFEASMKVGPQASVSPPSPASHHLASSDASSPQSVQVCPAATRRSAGSRLPIMIS